MMAKPIFTGDGLYQLIPQRPPIVMTDALFSATDVEADTGLKVLEDNVFCECGLLREPGVIEHIAQSAAAFAGYGNFKAGNAPQLGYIAEIRKFQISRLPKTGDRLRTHLTVLGAAMGMSLVAARTEVVPEGQEPSWITGETDESCLVAEGQMKIFIVGDEENA